MRQKFKALIYAALYTVRLIVQPRPDRRAMVPFLFLLTLSLASCGGGDDEDVEEVTVENFQVVGNAPPANGREQIVAAINNGAFQILIDIKPRYSDDATIWISDRANFEQQIAHFICLGIGPQCHYSFVIDCTFTFDNRVACGRRLGGDPGPIRDSNPVADITPVLSGNQADLVMVLRVDAGPFVTAAERILPVTFRHN